MAGGEQLGSVIDADAASEGQRRMYGEFGPAYKTVLTHRQLFQPARDQAGVREKRGRIDVRPLSSQPGLKPALPE